MRDQSKTSLPERRPGLLVILVACIVAAMTFGVFSGDTQAQDNSNLPQAKFTGGGPEACLKCHGGPAMILMADTPHGNAGNRHTPYGQESCESCHGPGSFHVSSARGGVGFPLLNDFKYVGTPKPGQFNSCIGCHAEPRPGHRGIGWVGSLHDVAGLSCSTCHETHALDASLAPIPSQQSVCGTCHGRANNKHAGFENNGILIDQLQCTTCHDVHMLTARQ